ncbi:MAG TPA: hypothetical protein PKE32_04520 [Miltoncostaeaceae bacterium]|nr:hypothetical protein [Miltoncostaeaceae bacterium]
MSVLTYPEHDHLSFTITPIPTDGLLAHVFRPCPEHGTDAHCVGRDDREGRLVFWCERGEHHLTTR